MAKRLIPRSVVMVEATKPTIDDAGSLDIPEGQTYQIGGVPHTHDGLSGGGGTAVSIFAGAGLTGGGLLTGSRVLDVGAGTLIGVTADAVNLADGTEQYQVPVTGATPFTPAWTALSTFAGTALNFTSGAFHLDVPGTLSASSTNQAIDAHTHQIDTTLARAAVTITAGAGLTGGGDLTANRTIDVGAGTLITVAADSVSLAVGTAQYQVPVTGATPFTPAYTLLSTFAGTALNFTSGAFHLDVPGTLSASSTNQAIDAHTHAIDATLARVTEISNMTLYACSSALNLTSTATTIPGLTVNFTPNRDEYALVFLVVRFDFNLGTNPCNAGDACSIYLGGDLFTRIADGSVGSGTAILVKRQTLVSGSPATINAGAANLGGNRGQVNTNSHMLVWRVPR